jgi:hypothetical protein
VTEGEREKLILNDYLLSFKYVLSFIDLYSSNHNTVFFVRLVDLADSVDQASISEGEVLLDREVPILLHSTAHDLLQAGVDDVELRGTLDLLAVDLLVTHDFEETHL